MRTRSRRSRKQSSHRASQRSPPRRSRRGSARPSPYRSRGVARANPARSGLVALSSHTSPLPKGSGRMAAQAVSARCSPISMVSNWVAPVMPPQVLNPFDITAGLVAIVLFRCQFGADPVGGITRRTPPRCPLSQHSRSRGGRDRAMRADVSAGTASRMFGRRTRSACSGGCFAGFSARCPGQYLLAACRRDTLATARACPDISERIRVLAPPVR